MKDRIVSWAAVFTMVVYVLLITEYKESIGDFWYFVLASALLNAFSLAHFIHEQQSRNE